MERRMIAVVVLFSGLALVHPSLMAQESPSIQRFLHDWNHAKALDGKSAVGIATLPASQCAALVAAVKRWDRELGRKSDTEDPTLSEMTIEPVHLRTAHSTEIVMSGYCSPTGNCSIWILQPTNEGYRVVLESLGQAFSIGVSRTASYRDIFVSMHGSAYEATVKFYKFDGSRYKRAGCYDASFEVLDKAGNAQELKEPLVTPCRTK